MATIPKTSVALLNAIAASPDSPRWTEFYDRYQPILAAWLQSEKFRGSIRPSDVDEIIQRTMIAFMNKAPNYRYDPQAEGKGPFHSYLLLIARNKALEFIRNRGREAKKRDNFMSEFDVLHNAGKLTVEDKQLALIAKIAVNQVLNDKSISVRDREVFKRTTGGEAPESVAEAFGITRNNVDQIKARIMRKVREVADKLNQAE